MICNLVFYDCRCVQLISTSPAIKSNSYLTRFLIIVFIDKSDKKGRGANQSMSINKNLGLLLTICQRVVFECNRTPNNLILQPDLGQKHKVDYSFQLHFRPNYYVFVQVPVLEVLNLIFFGKNTPNLKKLPKNVNIAKNLESCQKVASNMKELHLIASNLKKS